LTVRYKIFRDVTRPELDVIVGSFSDLQKLEGNLVDSQNLAISFFKTETLPVLKLTQKELSDMVGLMSEKQIETREKMLRTASASTQSSIVVTVVALVLAVIISQIIVQHVTAPIRK
jgi:hypothetical protein